MPQLALPIGQLTTMSAGIAYALPATAVTLFTDAVAPTITQSNNAAFSGTPVAVTLTGGQARVVGGFIKAVADALVILKRD